jgi:hypothetical protein
MTNGGGRVKSPEGGRGADRCSSHAGIFSTLSKILGRTSPLGRAVAMLFPTGPRQRSSPPLHAPALPCAPAEAVGKAPRRADRPVSPSLLISSTDDVRR